MIGNKPASDLKFKHGLRTTCLAAALIVSIAAAIPTQTREDGSAKGGSPLYGIVVADAVNRLARSGREAREQAREPEPCPRCGRVHGTPQAVPDAEAAAEQHVMPVADSADMSRRPGSTAQIPQSESPKYVYCSQCRIYHRKDEAENGKPMHP